MQKAIGMFWAAACLLVVFPASTRAGIEREVITYDLVRSLAAERASKDYAAPPQALPRWLANLDYDAMRKINFRRDKALWREEGLPLQLQLFHRTGQHRARVRVHEFSPTHVQELPFVRDFFEYGGGTGPGRLRSSLGYAGLRLTHPLNRPDRYDEVISFLGASYFRGLGAGQIYGLSARGLALDSGLYGQPEEFPYFTDFWVQKPSAETREFTIYALLDSPTVAGAYAFVVQPGPITVVEVRAELHFRASAGLLGIAPLTSMFWYGENTDRPPGEFRPEVHDSDGLLLQYRDGARVWRPLHNPTGLRNTDLPAEPLEGFGLMQRDRAVSHYEDLEARYHQRPSLWIEPQGEWGEGHVRLVELPTRDEYGDNIVAFWVPAEVPPPGEPVRYDYRMTWRLDDPATPLARVHATRQGALPDGSPGRLFWIDFTGDVFSGRSEESLDVVIELPPTATIHHQTLIRHPEQSGWRVALQVKAAEGSGPIPLLVRLREGYEPLTETWRFDWQP